VKSVCPLIEHHAMGEKRSGFVELCVFSDFRRGCASVASAENSSVHCGIPDYPPTLMRRDLATGQQRLRHRSP